MHRLDVISLAGDKVDRRRGLRRRRVPVARCNVDVGDVGDLDRVCRVAVRAEPKLAVVVAGDPKTIRAAHARFHKTANALTVSFCPIRRRLELTQCRNRRRVVRVAWIIS